jgi:RimJ/RimL family protein N-acetyltransferase
MLERFGWRRRHQRPYPDEAPPVDAEAPLIRAGTLVQLREHLPANKSAFQRWYADREIAYMLRHDLEPLSFDQSASYFDSLILPLSHRRLSYAIHENDSGRLIGTSALTDFVRRTTGRRSALFRIVIGERDVWDRGYGTEATRLVVAEAFTYHDLTEVRLEVFRHNPRAITAYERVGFMVTGEHVEWVGRGRSELNVIEMRLRRPDWEEQGIEPAVDSSLTPEDDVGGMESGESSEAHAARIARRRRRQQKRRTQSQVHAAPSLRDDATAATEETTPGA